MQEMMAYQPSQLENIAYDNIGSIPSKYLRPQ